MSWAHTSLRKSRARGIARMWALDKTLEKPLTFSCKHLHLGYRWLQGQPAMEKGVAKGCYVSRRRHCGLKDNDNNYHLKG